MHLPLSVEKRAVCACGWMSVNGIMPHSWVYVDTLASWYIEGCEMLGSDVIAHRRCQVGDEWLAILREKQLAAVRMVV